jgi:membrane-associated PAP2 superfamily phosphatase
MKNRWVLLALFVAFLIFELSDIDILIQDYFYNFTNKTWVLDKNSPLPKMIFYDGIKNIYALFVVTLLISLVFFRRRFGIIKRAPKQWLVVLLSCVIVPLFIGYLKSITNMPCPKDLKRYNGTYPYTTVLSSYPSSFQALEKIKCYPAGHASGGFALMSLFFLFSVKRKKILALLLTCTLGWATGGYKMLIGDHFFSHTFITMALAWLLILNINFWVKRFNVKKKLT